MGKGQRSQSLGSGREHAPLNDWSWAHSENGICRPGVGEKNSSWGMEVFTGAGIEAQLQEVPKMRFRAKNRMWLKKKAGL